MASNPTYKELEERVREMERGDAERRRVEDTLKTSEQEKLSILNSLSSLLTYYKTRELKIEWANQTTADAIGKPLDDLVGRHCFAIWHGSNKPCDGCPILRTFDTGCPEKAEDRSHDGKTLWLLQSYPVKDEQGQVIGVLGVTEDVTRTRQTEQERERLFQTIETARQAIIITSSDPVIQYTNRATDRLFGYEKGELIGRHPSILNAGPDPEAVPRAIVEGIEEKGFWEGEILNKKKDGTEFITYARITPHKDKDGQVSDYISIQHDITERKRMEAELREHRDHLERFVAERTAELKQTNEQLQKEIAERKRAQEQLQESRDRYARAEKIGHLGHWDGDFKTDSSVWSRELYNIFGVDSKQVESTFETFLTFVHSSDRPRLEREVRRAIKRGGDLDLEYRIVRPDGSVRYIHSLATVLKDENGKPERSFGMLQDITERKLLEEEIAKIQQLDALGLLAGGLAHDFNNMLTAILANISMARVYGDSEPDIVQLLKDAEAATLRAKGLTQQLLAFAKGGAPITKPASVADLIKDTADFTLSGSNVRCRYRLPKALWMVEVDEGQIGQVLQNLILNADQAMPEGGEIKIWAENIALKEKEHPTLGAGRYVRIFLEDEGSGIAEKQLSKIFDPFFSTKEKGRGLGLTTSFSIVNRHGGHIHVESKVGIGTTFQVYLPAAERVLMPDRKTEDGPPAGEGRILLIDDEEMVLKSAGEILKRLGYEVAFSMEGRQGIQAYRKAKQEGRPFAAVIMDLTIPGGMGGKEAIRKLLEEDPEAKVIVSSGYSDDPVMSDFRHFGFSGVVLKPYRIHDLGDALRRVIAQAQK